MKPNLNGVDKLIETINSEEFNIFTIGLSTIYLKAHGSIACGQTIKLMQ